MKKLFIFLLAISFGRGSFAQDSAHSPGNNIQKPSTQTNEGVIMKDGKLLMVKDGQTTAMTSDLTLDNGAIVTADGRVKNKDGTITTLGEGDYIAMDGTPGNVTNWQQKNKSKKDSAR